MNWRSAKILWMKFYCEREGTSSNGIGLYTDWRSAKVLRRFETWVVPKWRHTSFLWSGMRFSMHLWLVRENLDFAFFLSWSDVTSRFKKGVPKPQNWTPFPPSKTTFWDDLASESVDRCDTQEDRFPVPCWKSDSLLLMSWCERQLSPNKLFNTK